MNLFLKDLEKCLAVNGETFKDIIFVNKSLSYFENDCKETDQEKFSRYILLFTKKGQYNFKEKYCKCGKPDCQLHSQNPYCWFKPCEPPTNWEEVELPNFKNEYHEL